MKTYFLIVAALGMLRLAWGQETGHYDLISVNETIRGEQYTVTITSWERQKVEIAVDKPANVSLEISVRTADRQLLQSERASRFDQRVRRVLNLTQLETGRYWLDIWVGKNVIHRELRIEAVEQTYRSLSLHP